MANDPKQKARAEVRRAQTEFERAQERVQRERAKARAARRERFAKAQKDGLTVREIADRLSGLMEQLLAALGGLNQSIDTLQAGVEPMGRLASRVPGQKKSAPADK